MNDNVCDEIESIIIYTDGSSENPGIGAYAAIIRIKFKNQSGLKISMVGTKKESTSNYMEYISIIKALEMINNKKFNASNANITIYSDSELVVNQILGKYMVRSSSLRPLNIELLGLISKLKDKSCNIVVQHIPREQNKEADKLAYTALDEFKKNGNEEERLWMTAI